MKWPIEELVTSKQVCLYCVFFNDSLGDIVEALGEQWCTECNLPVSAMEQLTTWQITHIKHWHISDNRKFFIAETPDNTEAMITELRLALEQRIELHNNITEELEEGLQNIEENQTT